MRILTQVVFLLAVGFDRVWSFIPGSSFGLTRALQPTTRVASAVAEAPSTIAESSELKMAEYILSPVERARTVAAACTSGTFCTSCKNDDGAPFGSHVDYVLDENGWPVLLLNGASVHTQNVAQDPRASLFAQMPSKTGEGQPSAAMARVSVLGTVVPVADQDELFALRAAYSVAHGWATRLVESDKFTFFKLKPERVYYMGGFGVDAAWVDLQEYEAAEADPLALDSLALVNKLNTEQQDDLLLLCNQFVPGLDGLSAGKELEVQVTCIDRLGLDIRVATQSGTKTDEYRIGFSLNVLTMEDAKSEIGKIFQEAWEKEQGEYWEDMGPPIVKTQISLL